MTSSEKKIILGQPRWNFNSQLYKDNRDVFLEPGLFSIIFLAHGRPDITKRCFLSTLDAVNKYDGEIEWIFIENGENEINAKFFNDLDLKRKVVIRNKNYGINHGLNQGWAVSRGEYIMIHENDWECRMPVDFFTPAKAIFEHKSEVGIIQLRDPYDPHENHGRGKPEYNPWSCSEEQLNRAGIKVWAEKTPSGHVFLISEYPNGFNNNPVFIRKNIYRECGPYPEPEVGHDPRHGETEYQARVAYLGCAIAYIGMPIYWHMGRIQTQAI